jgi:hypothetical protein
VLPGWLSYSPVVASPAGLPVPPLGALGGGALGLGSGLKVCRRGVRGSDFTLPGKLSR